MLSKNQKRLILIIVDIFFSSYIYYFNTYVLGNYDTPLKISLSITTFLIVFTPFEIYWSFRDIWFDRWIPLDVKDISKNKVQIEVKDGYLHADLIKPKDQEKIKKKNTVIIVSHGFSDTKETLQYYCFPMAQQGYVVLAYDARGIGESKKTGKRSQFIKRIDDFNKIIEWIKEDDNMKEMRIFCAGFSIGALTVLCGGFENKGIDKIIGISSMSNYRQNIPKFNLLVLFSYYIKGVKLFPKEEENKKISPYILFSRLKDIMSDEEWSKFSKRVMLIHCKNDKVIKFKNFRENRLVLESSPENMLILKKGGHSQKKNELALVGATLIFFKS